ncbi:MAG: toll/interleukin-1 receptor domain-containing protein [Nannocystaceae bacterium]
MADIFISYKREDEARVRPLVEGLEAEGRSVFWDLWTTAGERWHERISRELKAARCVVVAWSKSSVAPDAEFVRDEARRALELDVLLPIRIDAVRPPLGFGERQALDLEGWKGDRTDLRYLDLVAAVAAKLEGKALPRPQWPARRRHRRSMAWAIGGPLTVATVLAVSADARRTVCYIPGVRSACAATGVGEIPTDAEQVAWGQALAVTSGDGLREYLRAYPRGVFAEEARARLHGCQTTDEVYWDDDTIRHGLVIPAATTPYPTEPDAVRSTLTRAPDEAAAACRPFSTDVFRLRSSAFELDRTDCKPRQGGYVCVAHGFAVCEVQRRQTISRETCNSGTR